MSLVPPPNRDWLWSVDGLWRLRQFAQEKPRRRIEKIKKLKEKEKEKEKEALDQPAPQSPAKSVEKDVTMLTSSPTPSPDASTASSTAMIMSPTPAVAVASVPPPAAGTKKSSKEDITSVEPLTIEEERQLRVRMTIQPIKLLPWSFQLKQ